MSEPSLAGLKPITSETLGLGEIRVRKVSTRIDSMRTPEDDKLIGNGAQFKEALAAAVSDSASKNPSTEIASSALERKNGKSAAASSLAYSDAVTVNPGNFVGGKSSDKQTSIG